MDRSVQQVRLPASYGLCDVIYRTVVPSSPWQRYLRAMLTVSVGAST